MEGNALRAERPAREDRETLESVVVRIAGDSGDGIQLTGTQFTQTTAFAGNDLATFPDFPAEIRAPAGTTFGVSAFQIHFGARDICTPGDAPDVLVAMNPGRPSGASARPQARRHPHRQLARLQRAQLHQGRLSRRTRSRTARSAPTA